MTKTATEIMTEENNRIALERMKVFVSEIEALDDRELLYRFSIASGAQEVMNFRCLFNEKEVASKEKSFYEHELLKRLGKRTNRYHEKESRL